MCVGRNERKEADRYGIQAQVQAQLTTLAASDNQPSSRQVFYDLGRSSRFPCSFYLTWQVNLQFDIPMQWVISSFRPSVHAQLMMNWRVPCPSYPALEKERMKSVPIQSGPACPGSLHLATGNCTKRQCPGLQVTETQPRRLRLAGSLPASTWTCPDRKCIPAPALASPRLPENLVVAHGLHLLHPFWTP